MCFYQRLLFSCGHHHCKIERACKRKNSLDQPCHDKQFRNILEDHVCLPCLGKTDAINCTTQDLLKGEICGPNLLEERSAGVESQRECTIRVGGLGIKTCMTTTNTPLPSRPTGSLNSIDGLDPVDNIGINESSWTKVSGSSSEISHPIKHLTARRLVSDGPASQDFFKASGRRLSLTAIDHSASLSSGFSGIPSKSTTVIT